MIRFLTGVIFIPLLCFSMPAYSDVYNCGNVKIIQVLAGPRHGGMMYVDNASCGNQGWVCLDPNAETLTQQESDRLYSLVLAFYMANKTVNVSVYPDLKPASCSGYPVVEDIRG